MLRWVMAAFLSLVVIVSAVPPAAAASDPILAGHIIAGTPRAGDWYLASLSGVNSLTAPVVLDAPRTVSVVVDHHFTPLGYGLRLGAFAYEGQFGGDLREEEWMTVWTLLAECRIPQEGHECTLPAGTDRIWLQAEWGLDLHLRVLG